MRLGSLPSTGRHVMIWIPVALYAPLDPPRRGVLAALKGERSWLMFRAEIEGLQATKVTSRNTLVMIGINHDRQLLLKALFKLDSKEHMDRIFHHVAWPEETRFLECLRTLKGQ